MAAPKIVHVLSTFDKQSWDSFKKFVLNNYSENSDTYRIFCWLSDKKSDLQAMDAPYEYAKKQFKSMSSKVFLNHLSLLYGLAEDWMVNDQLNHETTTFKLLLHRNLQKRGIYHLADQISNHLQKELSRENTLDSLSARKEILHQKYYSFNPIKYQKGAAALSQVMDSAFDYIYHLLSIYQVELTNFGKIQKHDYKQEEEKLLIIIQQLQKSENDLFFHKMHQLIKFDKTEYLEALKDNLISGQWPKGSLEEVISTLYLIRKSTELFERGSDLPTTQIISELFVFAMKQGVYAEHGKLAPVTFRNIIGQLCRFQSFEYIQDFINKWYIKISAKYPESTRNVCHAMNCLNHEKYNEIYHYTRMKHFSEETEKAKALSLYLIACFMDRKRNYDLYINTLHNFTSYLNRHKTTFSTKFYNGLLNTVVIMKKMDQGRPVDLNIYNTIFYRSWCEKITSINA